MRRRRIRGVETLNNKLTVSIRKVYLPDGEVIVFTTTYHMMDDLYVTKVVYSGDHQVIYIPGLVTQQAYLTYDQLAHLTDELGVYASKPLIQYCFIFKSTNSDDDGEKVYSQRIGSRVVTKRYLVQSGHVALHAEITKKGGYKVIYNIFNTGRGRDTGYMGSLLAQLTN